MAEFVKSRTEYTAAGDLNTSGNGSVMRNGPVSAAFWRNPNEAMAVAARQSKTTHQGDEAAECCRLLSWICAHGIQGGVPKKTKSGAHRALMEQLCSSFPTESYSVGCLARAEAEERRDSNKKFSLKDRDWSWRTQDYQYSPQRAKEQPGYIGSYAMDNLSMALHCVYTTDTFGDALRQCLCRGGADRGELLRSVVDSASVGESRSEVGWWGSHCVPSV